MDEGNKMTIKKEDCGNESCHCSSQKEETFWQDIHQKEFEPGELKHEFVEGEFDSFSVVKNRRNFLKVMGFSFTLLPMASCSKGTVMKAVPFLEKNDVIVPGVATWFATTHDGVPLLVKTREGRPIKVEGNDKSKWTFGGASAISQASILSLYDSYRIKGPLKDGQSTSWEVLEKDLIDVLNSCKKEGKKIAIISDEIRSPSSASLLDDFAKGFGLVEHIVYSAKSKSLIPTSLDVPESDFYYSISDADYVLSFEADFLGTDPQSVAYSRQYAEKKNLKDGRTPLKHVQVESLMSLTGSNADDRYPLDPGDIKTLLLLILSKIGGNVAQVTANAKLTSYADKISKDLLSHKSKSIVLCDSSNLDFQIIVNQMNVLLGNFGKTVRAYKSEYFKLASEDKFEQLLDSLLGAKFEYGAVLFLDVNPVHSYRDSERIKEALGKVHPKFSFTFGEDETSTLCEYVAPIHHVYESWNDTIVGPSELSVTQAVISPLYSTKQIQDVLLKTLGRTESFAEYMKDFWGKKFFSTQKQFLTVERFWTQTVHDGVIELPGLMTEIQVKERNISRNVDSLIKSIEPSGQYHLVLYEKVGIKDGKYINNPWLQEMPDPITKATWDNYLLVSPHIATKNSLVTGMMVELIVKGKFLVLPVLVQPGLAKNVMGVAVGYGRTVTGKVGKDVGKNAYPLATYANGVTSWVINNAVIQKTGATYEIALTQTHHSLEGRDIVRETTFGAYKQNPKAGNEHKTHLVSMWGKDPDKGHQWAMAIDLNKCNGCSACVVSCNAENNVPVVGRQEVLNRREMHWMRIDRYYKGPEDWPSVTFQPMTCQHCENAPCESVCPVLATVHSSDGMNQQVYNRCVGTRYCANNCPYKVRRFNWFDYPHTDPNENMVLNPDVAVRSRGVMEKCSMCIQRVQESKLNAKKEGRELRDGEIKLACQQSCSSNAIVFGDMNDPKSEISRVLKDQRNFTVLEELNVKPRLSYLTKVRNKE
jgi:molybdopterin-containing oxidoreductase family iron-sulfur binding subunit